MDTLEALKAQGYKPEASTDGEWTPLKGTYEVQVAALRPEQDKQYGKVYQLELTIVNTLDGDLKRESKFADFRRRYYLDGDKAEANLKKLLNDMFTIGVTLDTGSTDAMEASFANAIGQKGYVRAWGYTPEGKDTMQQSFVFQKEKVALKKKGKNSVPF